MTELVKSKWHYKLDDFCFFFFRRTVPPPPVTNPLGPALTDQPPPNFGQQPPGTPGEGLPVVPLSDFMSPPRPNIGSEGRTIPLRANHFQVRVPKGIIHHYEVSISPDKCPRRVNR